MYKNKALCCYKSIQEDIFLSINWVTTQQNKTPIRFRSFDIVVLPVFTCYVHKFYENKTNNYLKHIFHMQTEGLRIYNIYV